MMMRYAPILLILLLRPMPVTDTVVYLPLIMSPPSKAGLAWPDNASVEAAALLGASWWYDYNVRLDMPQIGRMQFIPYFWCDTWPAHKYTGEVSRYFEIAAAHGMDANYSGYLLFLNEPDMPGSDTGGQCDMSPRQAAYLYKALREEFPNATFVGPNMSHEDYVAGWPWLRAWYTVVSNLGLPYPDKAAAHSYLDAAQRLQQETMNEIQVLIDLIGREEIK